MRNSKQGAQWDVEAPGLNPQSKSLKDKGGVTKSEPRHHF